MSEVGDEKPVGPNGANLGGSVVFTPEQAARLEENKRLDQAFIARFKKLRAEKAEKLDREQGYVPQSVNGKEVHLGAVSEAKPSKSFEPNRARFRLTRFRDIAITEGVA